MAADVAERQDRILTACSCGDDDDDELDNDTNDDEDDNGGNDDGHGDEVVTHEAATRDLVSI